MRSIVSLPPVGRYGATAPSRLSPLVESPEREETISQAAPKSVQRHEPYKSEWVAGRSQTDRGTVDLRGYMGKGILESFIHKHTDNPHYGRDENNGGYRMGSALDVPNKGSAAEFRSEYSSKPKRPILSEFAELANRQPKVKDFSPYTENGKITMEIPETRPARTDYTPLDNTQSSQSQMRSPIDQPSQPTFDRREIFSRALEKADTPISVMTTFNPPTKPTNQPQAQAPVQKQTSRFDQLSQQFAQQQDKQQSQQQQYSQQQSSFQQPQKQQSPQPEFHEPNFQHPDLPQQQQPEPTPRVDQTSYSYSQYSQRKGDTRTGLYTNDADVNRVLGKLTRANQPMLPGMTPSSVGDRLGSATPNQALVDKYYSQRRQAPDTRTKGRMN
jgi:hypothetical protein